MGTRDTTGGIIVNLTHYVSTRNDLYIHLAGLAITQSSNQRATLNRVAKFLVDRDDKWLDSMVHIMTQTHGVIAFDMRDEVRRLRMPRA